MIVWIDGVPKGVDGGVARYVDVFSVMVLLEQVLPGPFGRCKVEAADDVRDLPVDLLGIRIIAGVCAQAGFNVADGNFLVKSSNCGGQRRRGIAVNEGY